MNNNELKDFEDLIFSVEIASTKLLQYTHTCNLFTERAQKELFKLSLVLRGAGAALNRIKCLDIINSNTDPL